MRRLVPVLFATIVLIALSAISAQAGPPEPAPETPQMSQPGGRGAGEVGIEATGVCNAASTYTKYSSTAVGFSSYTSCTYPAVLGVTSKLWDWFNGQWYQLAQATHWCYWTTYCSAGGFECCLDPGLYKVTGWHYCSNCIPQSINSLPRLFNMP